VSRSAKTSLTERADVAGLLKDGAARRGLTMGYQSYPETGRV
jgi:hypothetical protein